MGYNQKLVQVDYLIYSLLWLFYYYFASSLDIGGFEADIFFGDSWLSYIIHLTTDIFGRNNFGLRVIFVTTHIINLILLYNYTKDKRVLYLYSILPAVNASIFVVSKVPFIVTLLLIFLMLFKSRRYILIIPLIIFFDKSSIIIAIALLLYGFYYREKMPIFISLIMIFTIFSYYDYSNLGKPKGYFVDIFGIFLALLSPLLLFYLIYSIFVDKIKDILWFIVATSLVVAVILSFRQKVAIEFFAPFLLLSVIIICRVFLNGYYTLIKSLRKRYNILLIITIFIAFISSMILYLPVFDDFDRQIDKNGNKSRFYMSHLSNI